jgi:hypothetical protein
MLLSTRILNNVAGVNSFEYVQAATFTAGDTPSVYFQLIDASVDRATQGFVPAGRRFMPAAGATLEVTLDSVDNARKIVRSASQPFPLDPSIWKVDILSTDNIKGTVSMALKLTEGIKITRGRLTAALLISSVDTGC